MYFHFDTALSLDVLYECIGRNNGIVHPMIYVSKHETYHMMAINQCDVIGGAQMDHNMCHISILYIYIMICYVKCTMMLN